MITVPTPVGDAMVAIDQPSAVPKGLLVLGHGAGGGIDAPDLRTVTAAARERDIAVALVVQPYRVAGRRSPAPARALDVAWTAVIDQLTTSFTGLMRSPLPVVVGGRSSGARVACRTASAVGACGVLALAFPLHPPGHPEKSRVAELDVAVPLLVVQGDRDAFGAGHQFPPDVAVQDVVGADHRLANPAFREAMPAVMSWLVATMVAASGAEGIGSAQPVL